MRRLIPTIVGMLSITAACHNLKSDTAAGQLAAVVVFSNESFDEAAVYAVLPSAQTVRIGTVMSGRTDTLTVPPTISNTGQSVNLVVRPLAKNIRPQSGPISLGAGDWVHVTLPPDERMLVVLPVRQ